VQTDRASYGETWRQKGTQKPHKCLKSGTDTKEKSLDSQTLITSEFLNARSSDFIGIYDFLQPDLY
jgi:hypothetical protein